MFDKLDNLDSAVTARLAREQRPTAELIRELIRKHRLIDDYAVDDAAAELLAKIIEARLSITMAIGSVLKSEDYEPWLDDVRAAIVPYYWDRYRQLLTGNRFSPQVVATIDDVTNRILGLLENPEKAGQWDRRGLVVGHVQSGKTANYIGLIAKAADAGYKVIIVIAGVHNNLRNQTQLRIDEGFVGRNSSRLLTKKADEFIGVGCFDNQRRPITFTNSVRDFNKGLATSVGIPLQELKEPAVFVIKKNATTLKNLHEWLKEHSARGGGARVDLPILLIDDEADNASINIKKGEDEVSRINAQIRNLLQMFDRRCYVGYTATPFANIFIDPDTDHKMLHQDLFPKNFIVSLDAPSNYFGASKVFLENPNSYVQPIEESADWLPLTHPIWTEVRGISGSLLEAIRTFVIGCAIRIARGHENAHCSMLVNVSRFTGVQKQVRNEIHHALDQIFSSVRTYSALPSSKALQYPELDALQRIWQSQFSNSGFTWDIVQRCLLDAISPIRVVEVNSSSSGALNYADYPKGLSVIAVGGFSLSRGLTLEGLMVSYFLRNSVMYDTLMQMGRWFGYRYEYEDLCRIWMLEEAQGWYEHISESIELLRDDLRTMERLGATPAEFGLKVRAHPDTLIVTARNKMRSSETVTVEIGLGNSFIETATLKWDEVSLRANRAAAYRLVDSFSNAGHSLNDAQIVDHGLLISNAPVEPILDFLTEFQHHPGSMTTNPELVRQYIIERRDTELSLWDVLIVSLKKMEGDAGNDDFLGVNINRQRRKPGDKSNMKSGTLLITNKQRVASRGVEQTGLTREEIEKARQVYREKPDIAARLKQGELISYPDLIYREYRKRPLLMIHLLAIGNDKEEILRRPETVVAWSMSFPKTETPEKRVRYQANTIWLRENFGSDFDEDEMSGDDD